MLLVLCTFLLSSWISTCVLCPGVIQKDFEFLYKKTLKISWKWDDLGNIHWSKPFPRTPMFYFERFLYYLNGLKGDSKSQAVLRDDTKDDNWSRRMTFHQPVVYFWLSALVSLLSLLNLDVNINLQHFLAWHIFMDKGKWDSVWFCLPLEPCYGWTSLSHLAQACFSFALGFWYSPPIILPRSEIVVLNNERQNAFSYFGSCSIFICTITLQLTCCFFFYYDKSIWVVLSDLFFMRDAL